MSKIRLGLDDFPGGNISLHNLNNKNKVSKMKGYLYIVLIVGFFLFYQQNPMYAIIMIVIFIGGYIFIKSRKSGSGIGGFLKGKASQSNANMDDLITLMMLQQLTNNSNSEFRKFEEQTDDEHEKHIEKVKQETLALLDE